MNVPGGNAWSLLAAGGKMMCDTGLWWSSMVMDKSLCQARRAVSEKEDEDRN